MEYWIFTYTWLIPSGKSDGKYTSPMDAMGPICFMYEIFIYIYHKFSPNVGKYFIHGAYGDYDSHYCSYLKKSTEGEQFEIPAPISNTPAPFGIQHGTNLFPPVGLLHYRLLFWTFQISENVPVTLPPWSFCNRKNQMILLVGKNNYIRSKSINNTGSVKFLKQNS